MHLTQVVAAEAPVASEALADAPAESSTPAEAGDAPSLEQHGEAAPSGAPAAEQEIGSGTAPEEGERGEATAVPAEGEEGATAEGAITAEEGGESATAEGEAAPSAEGEAAVAEGEAPAGEESAAAAEPEDAGPPPPPPPPPYIPPEVGDDYIPVAELPALPLPYGMSEEGKKIPLPGIESIFLTGEG